jgi:dynactin-2
MLFKPESQKKLTEELVKRIQVLKSAPEVDGTKKGGSGGSVRYEVTIDKDRQSLRDALRFEELERRMANIEKVVGFSPQTQTNESLTARVDKLYRIARHLDQAKLDELQSKAQSLLMDFELLQQKRNELQVNEADLKKIDELHELFAKTQPVIDELPALVDRMETLKALHEESATFSLKVKELQGTQQSMLASLNDNSKLLQEVIQRRLCLIL